MVGLFSDRVCRRHEIRLSPLSFIDLVTQLDIPGMVTSKTDGTQCMVHFSL